MTRPITVGVDGSAESLAAVHWAAREAVRRSLALRVVHAWEKSDGEDRTGDVREALAETAREVTGRHPDLPVNTDLLEGDRVDALVAAAADAETLVLGTRGHGAIVGFLLGSVGQQVVAESARPVVLVRAG
ncbi:universal stress protein, partial [Streptomyces sp. NPDC058656]